MSKPPIAIRLIAWSLIVLGTLSISEILVQFFLYDQFHFDLNVFLVPIGRGLLRGSEISRWWASVFLGLGSFGVLIGLAANVYYSFYEQPDSVTLGLGPLPCVVLLVVFAWAWRESCSKRTREWFASKPLAVERWKPFQFRLFTMLLCTTLVAIVCVAHRKDIIYYPAEIHSTVSGTTEGNRCISYGVHRLRRDPAQGIVDFVVIETAKRHKTFRLCVRRSFSRGRQSAKLHPPEGRPFKLPGENQLYEINEGEIRTFLGTVIIQQLDAFLNQPHDDLGIEDLLAMPLAEEAVE